ncbi:MAG: peptide deformylase [candidate division KSB1 bacterium]|nr:peptide deformylase [candidate division KSB1 bacterium]MDZ7345202.1 peptide deformylase [candidate division KSB1 bacterium]
MALLQVIRYGHPTLREKAKEVAVDQIDQKFIDDMLETMYKEDGVGLAATQVNVAQQILVCTDRQQEYVLINPKIVGHSLSRKSDYEGCLSLPGLHAMVPRYEKVIVKALDRNGKPIEIKATGLLAVILQHEIDHLNGILFIDRADLSTLSWVESEIVEEKLRGKPTTLSEVQKVFRDKYHRKQEIIQFDRTAAVLT